MKTVKLDITTRSNILHKSTQEAKSILSTNMTVEKSLVMDIMRCLVQNFGNTFNPEIDDIKEYYDAWFEVDYTLFRELYKKDEMKLTDIDNRSLKSIAKSIADTKIETFDKLYFEVVTIFPSVKIDTKRNVFSFMVNPLILKGMVSAGKIIGDENSTKMRGSYITYDYIKLHKSYGFNYAETALYQFILSESFKLKLHKVGFIDIDKLKCMCNIKNKENARVVNMINEAF